MWAAPSLPQAGQPDVVLSVQKDAYYRREVFEKLSKAVENVIGPHLAVTVRPETRLISELFYFGLTSFRQGQQSPGEEYCDLLQVQAINPKSQENSHSAIEQSHYEDAEENASGNAVNEDVDSSTSDTDSDGPIDNSQDNLRKKATERLIYLLPSSQQRVALMIYTVLIPYVFKRIKVGGWNSILSIFRPQLTARERAEQFRKRLAEQQQRRRRIEMGEDLDNGEIIQDKSLYDQLMDIWKQWKPLLPKMATVFSFMLLLERLHLGSFYIYGRYFSWAKRFAGIQYVNTKEPDSQRMSYKVLGIFLFIQVFLETYPTFSNMFWSLMKTWGVVWDSPEDSEAKSNSAVVPFSISRDSMYNETSDIDNALGSEQDGLSSKGPADIKCGICLSEPIDFPAAPKCGHMFCYDCILGSTLNKEECPVCRQTAKPRDLQCIYFSLPEAS